MNRTFELDYIKDQYSADSLVKLTSNMPFEGSRQIGRVANLNEAILPLKEAAAICNVEKIRPVMLPVCAIEYSWAP